MTKSINYFTSGQDWVDAMVSHHCASGRSYVVSDDTNNRSFGYECNMCGEIFRIKKDDLQNNSPSGLIFSLKDRIAFANKISNLKRKIANKKSNINPFYNREKLITEGVSITLR